MAEKHYTQKVFNSCAADKYGSDEPFYVHETKPLHVVIKPTMACPARCKHCSTRIKGFSKSAKIMGIADWERAFYEMTTLGTKTIIISGGEPLLYPQIDKLIYLASKSGFFVGLNTQAWLLRTDKVAESLVSAGLVTANISLDSASPKVHDALRGLSGLHSRVLNSIKLLLKAKSDIIINLRMVLSRHNFRELPEILELAYKAKATMLSIDQVEHDFERQLFLLSVKEIEEFRSTVVPKALSVIRKIPFKSSQLRDEAAKVLVSIFDNRLSSDDNYQKGVFWKDEKIKRHCTIPSSFFILQGDGAILPCNPVEYTRSPIMGNYFENSLTDLWNSRKWEEFRNNKMSYCRKCAMNHSSTIAFRIPKTKLQDRH